MGGEKGVGRRGKARRRRPPADVAPNDQERSRHGLAHVRGVARVPTTTAMSSSSARVRAGASTSSRWPSSYPGLPPRHDGQLLSPKLIVAPIERLKSRCVQVSPSFASPPQRRTRGSAASSTRSTPSTPRCGRNVLDACALFPDACHRQASYSLPAFSPPIAGCRRRASTYCRRPTAATLLLVGHRPPHTFPVIQRPMSSLCACTDTHGAGGARNHAQAS